MMHVEHMGNVSLLCYSVASMVMTYFHDPLGEIVVDWRIPKETLKTAYEPKTQTQTRKYKLTSTQVNPLLPCTSPRGLLTNQSRQFGGDTYQLSINSSGLFISYFV